MLLAYAHGLREADRLASARITSAVIDGVVGLIPDEWLDEESPVGDKHRQRRVYAEYLTSRLEARQTFVEEAIRARSLHV